jgi:hypothetical protein
MLSVTNHGGSLLPHVEVQALYYGQDWYNNSTYYNQTGSLEGYLNGIVNSSYMDMLANAGYGVGRGSFSTGAIDLANINKSQYLTDGALRQALQADILNGTLQQPDANRLYIIFVEDNVAVSNGSENSQNDFLGYHGAFLGQNSSSQAVDIHYAIIAYPGGSIGNASFGWLSSLGGLTEVASHELAEAVTDPNINYRTKGWYDDTLDGEVGDIVNSQTVYLNGYAVQRIADANDQAMTPAGATADTVESFVLQTNGNLYVHSAAGLTYLDSGIASVSDQAIDNHGHAMVDVVTTDGSAYEYHEGDGWKFLANNAVAAKAGQGVSYVQFGDGTLSEYKDAADSWTYLNNNVSRIDAGTDRFGFNMVDVIFNGGGAWEYSDTSGWHFLASGVQSISAGQQGISDFVLAGGAAYWYNEATGASVYLDGNVAQVSAGTDASGNFMIDLRYTNGNVWEYRVGSGWSYLDGGVQSISKGRAGLVTLVFSSGDAYDHDAAGNFSYLTGNTQAVA